MKTTVRTKISWRNSDRRVQKQAGYIDIYNTILERNYNWGTSIENMGKQKVLRYIIMSFYICSMRVVHWLIDFREEFNTE